MIRVHRTLLDQTTEGRLTSLTNRVVTTADADRTGVARNLWKTARPTRIELRAALENMAHGAGRCMYCGDSQGSDIDHFEPIDRNPLRTFDWLNHLLACSVCNSHSKRAHYPVDGRGDPLLIDPSVDDPFDHLLLTLSLGEYRAVSPRGQATIDVCGLNRRGLPRARTQARRVVTMALRTWSHASAVGDVEEAREALLVIREEPLADVAQSMLRQALSPRAHLVLGEVPDVVTALRDEGLRAALLI